MNNKKQGKLDFFGKQCYAVGAWIEGSFANPEVFRVNKGF